MAHPLNNLEPNEPLDGCPFCGYSLEGLPTEHACPECGQAFDRRWVIFGGKSSWDMMSWMMRSLLVAGFIALAVAGIVFLTDYLETRRRARDLVLLLPIGMSFISLIWTFRRGGHRVVVGPAGVSILQVRRGDRVDYSRREILNAELLDKRPMLNLRNPLRRIELMGLGRETEACMARINERVESGGSQ